MLVTPPVPHLEPVDPKRLLAGAALRLHILTSWAASVSLPQRPKFHRATPRHPQSTRGFCGPERRVITTSL